MPRGGTEEKAKVQLNMFAKAAAPEKGSFPGDSRYARAMNKFTTKKGPGSVFSRFVFNGIF
jgi:hypothetical protein